MARSIVVLVILSNFVRRAQRQRVNGERWRFAAAGRGKDTRIRDPQIAPAVVATGSIDHRDGGISTHTAGAKDMGSAEPIPT